METPLATLYSKIKEKRKLGIKQLADGILLPKYGFLSPKRGRKTCTKQLLKDGESKGQAKITNILKVGKGSPLPSTLR